MTSSFDAPSILAVGGRGFVGAAVIEHFLALGWRVQVFGPPGPVPLPAGATEIEGSIEDAAALRQAMEQTRPAAVLNFAAFASGPVGLARSAEADPERAMAINVLGFRRLLDACVACAVARVVWISSTVVLGPADDLKQRSDEDAPRRPMNNYALTKTLAEDVAAYFRRRHGLSVIGLRIPLMMGPRLWYEGAATPLKTLIAGAVTGGKAPEVGVPFVPFDAMHVADVGPLVEQILASAGNLAPIYNIAGFTTTYREIADTLSDMVPGYRPVLKEQNPPIIYPLVSQARIERDLGWNCRLHLRQTLGDMLAERRRSA